jgi:hypothetical protein
MPHNPPKLARSMMAEFVRDVRHVFRPSDSKPADGPVIDQDAGAEVP